MYAVFNLNWFCIFNVMAKNVGTPGIFPENEVFLPENRCNYRFITADKSFYLPTMWLHVHYSTQQI